MRECYTKYQIIDGT